MAKIAQHRCIYCHKITPSGLTLRENPSQSAPEHYCCSPGCRQKAERYFRFCRWGVPVFLLLTLLSLGLLLATVLGFSGNEKLTLAGMMLFGTSLILFPFPTSMTVERWGIRRSNLVLRLIGVVVLAASVALAWAIFW